MADRKKIIEENLDKVTGGSLQYVWDAPNQIGYVYSTDFSTKYYFNADNCSNVIDAVEKSKGNGKTDKEDLEDMMQYFFKIEG